MRGRPRFGLAGEFMCPGDSFLHCRGGSRPLRRSRAISTGSARRMARSGSCISSSAWIICWAGMSASKGRALTLRPLMWTGSGRSARRVRCSGGNGWRAVGIVGFADYIAAKQAKGDRSCKVWEKTARSNSISTKRASRLAIRSVTGSLVA